MPERLNGTVSKTVVRANVPWVRIPLPPPRPLHIDEFSKPLFAYAKPYLMTASSIIVHIHHLVVAKHDDHPIQPTFHDPIHRLNQHQQL